MILKTILKTSFFGWLLGTPSHADFAATNLSGHDLRLSLHGDGCRHFDGDRYVYPACAEENIAVNDTKLFCPIFQDEALSPKEKLVTPKIVFRTIGFTYVCRLTEFVELEVCNFIDYLLEQEEPKREHKPSNTALVRAGELQLSVDEQYHLLILKDWRLYPTPQVDCKLARIVETSESCLPKIETEL